MHFIVDVFIFAILFCSFCCLLFAVHIAVYSLFYLLVLQVRKQLDLKTTMTFDGFGFPFRDYLIFLFQNIFVYIAFMSVEVVSLLLN